MAGGQRSFGRLLTARGWVLWSPGQGGRPPGGGAQAACREDGRALVPDFGAYEGTVCGGCWAPSPPRLCLWQPGWGSGGPGSRMLRGGPFSLGHGFTGHTWASDVERLPQGTGCPVKGPEISKQRPSARTFGGHPHCDPLSWAAQSLKWRDSLSFLQGGPGGGCHGGLMGCKLIKGTALQPSPRGWALPLWLAACEGGKRAESFHGCGGGGRALALLLGLGRPKCLCLGVQVGSCCQRERDPPSQTAIPGLQAAERSAPPHQLQAGVVLCSKGKAGGGEEMLQRRR